MSRPDLVCQEAIRDAASFLSAHEEGQLSSERVQLDRNSDVLRWQRPLEGWFKINFDGGVGRQGKRSGLGSMLRIL
ncbi:hypothetical protein RHMOL_Rhmol06G0154700 [Rhododendron molle]|uniref:Uncharacterized protein n=1 Tax=Rhododendron molle TaxID=49168 RepID=A0ACC0NCX3_RHOML|nr:hypothetical protein RHMOL_Rhmol06G0154700 [Rhododendron molle]